MKHAWTGGQYSLWRALFGGALGAHFAHRLWILCTRSDASTSTIALAAVQVVLCIALILGVRHRLAALLLAAGLLAFPASSPVAAGGSTYLVCALLVLCACTRPAPYLSVPAIGRTDPGGSWILPNWVYACGWILLVAVCLHDIVPRAERALWDGATPAIAELGWKWFGWIAYLVPLAIIPSRLPYPWLALLACELWFGMQTSGSICLPMELTFAFAAAFDPGWIAPESPGTVDTVLYDGHCGLCHRLVRFLLAEDRRGSAFRFAPLDSERCRALIPAEERASLPDSVAVVTHDGRLLTRSSATRHTLARLGGIWRLAASVSGLLPTAVLDFVYDLIARVRHKLFARPAEACPLMPAHLRRRFEVQARMREGSQ
jgi:predicted DCC family thiol-disulfide oxidoreductase YuxK/uncharacterized membrane protein YphA (DoxX/SURF4 family)